MDNLDFIGILASIQEHEILGSTIRVALDFSPPDEEGWMTVRSFDERYFSVVGRGKTHDEAAQSWHDALYFKCFGEEFKDSPLKEK